MLEILSGQYLDAHAKVYGIERNGMTDEQLRVCIAEKIKDMKLNKKMVTKGVNC